MKPSLLSNRPAHPNFQLSSIPKFSTLAVVAFLTALAGAEAAPIAWYRMEGTSGAAISGVDNSISGVGAAPDSTATGATFNYSNVVAGPSIYDPIADQTYANTSSAAYNGTTSHSNLTVDNTPGSGPLNVPDFTVEMFVRLDSRLTSGEPYLATHGNPGADGWGIRVRNPENNPIAYVNNGSIYDSTDPAVVFDGAWHHLALVVKTSEDGSNYGKLYLDYNLVREVNGSSLNNYDPSVSGDMIILTEDYTGYIDEFRYSNSLLESTDFLVAVPEPSTFTLLAAAMLVVFAASRGRTKRQFRDDVEQLYIPTGCENR